MKGRHIFLVFGLILIIFSQNSLLNDYIQIKLITIAISLIFTGIYLGISIKSLEIDYMAKSKRVERKREDEEFMLSLEV